MTHRSWSFVAAACALVACTNDENFVRGAPAGPSISGSNKRDAGPKPEPDTDAGPMDGGSPVTYCTRVTVPAGGAEDNPIATFIDRPGDLTLTRQVERWTNDCKNLRLILEFSDGACPVGYGHSVTFSLDYQAILEGVIHGGNNLIGDDSETPAIFVRYVRPARLTPRGTWGTCAGADGQVVFVEAPVPSAGNYLRARYQLNLSACDGVTVPAQFLEGAFDVLLRTSATDGCPVKKKDGGV
jgi:hypothetical protein